MPHKSKGLTWYQLYNKISKMQTGKTKTDRVVLHGPSGDTPVFLGFENDGETPYLYTDAESNALFQEIVDLREEFLAEYKSHKNSDEDIKLILEAKVVALSQLLVKLGYEEPVEG